MGVGVRFDNCFGVYLCSWTTFIFYVTLNSDTWFWLNFCVIFDILWPQWTIFGAEERFINCFGVYSCSWTTSILHASVNSYICFNLIFGSFLSFWVIFFSFLGPNGLFWGLGKGSKIVLWSTHVVEQLWFCRFPSILVFDLYLVGVIFDFLGPNGLFFGLG